MQRSQVLVNDLLELVIRNQNQGTSGTTEHIGASTLEESLAALLRCNLGPGIKSSLVVSLSSSRLHNESKF